MQSALRLRVNGVRALAPARRQFTLSSARLADSIPPKSGSTMTDGNNTMDKGANNNVTSGDQSIGKTHAKDGGEDSIVPKPIQKAVPETVERALPDAVHNTGDSKKR